MPQPRTIVITGAASGIGRAWAEGFLAAGAQVVGVDTNAAGLAELAQQGAITQVADVTDATRVRACVELAVERTGRIDVLFNNAGLGFRTRIEALRDGEFERHVAVHLFGTIHGMRFAIPRRRAEQAGVLEREGVPDVARDAGRRAIPCLTSTTSRAWRSNTPVEPALRTHAAGRNRALRRRIRAHGRGLSHRAPVAAVRVPRSLGLSWRLMHS